MVAADLSADKLLEQSGVAAFPSWAQGAVQVMPLISHGGSALCGTMAAKVYLTGSLPVTEQA